MLRSKLIGTGGRGGEGVDGGEGGKDGGDLLPLRLSYGCMRDANEKPVMSFQTQPKGSFFLPPRRTKPA